MNSERQRLVIVGDSAIAEIAYEYFTHDSPYDVVGFAVESAYLTRTMLFDLPVVPMERIAESFPPAEHSVYVAVGYNQLNRLRTRLARHAKELGYALASYVSSRAFVWRNVTLGEHCFIFEHNVIQPFVTIGDNAVLWSGNHIGHHSRIRDNVFFASHVVLSGFCDVGSNCFLGVNATIANNVTIAPDCLLGAGCMILKDTEANRIYGAKMTTPLDRTARQYFKVPEGVE
jgi:sugar O-acyltransferase (sialic acid O-acetyltransferase NeuD family)